MGVLHLSSLTPGIHDVKGETTEVSHSPLPAIQALSGGTGPLEAKRELQLLPCRCSL